jgi:hypothetical protein
MVVEYLLHRPPKHEITDLAADPDLLADPDMVVTVGMTLAALWALVSFFNFSSVYLKLITVTQCTVPTALT